MAGLRVIHTQADIFVDCKPSNIEKSSSSLLKFRLCFYSVISICYLTLSTNLLSIDFESFDDPYIRRMREQRFTLLTIWMSLMHVAYFPLCFYLDWQEKNGRHFDKNTIRINKIRHFLFTAIICPSTLYADCFFWRVWNMDRELIVPSKMDAVLPFWAQHGLHTFTFITCMVELITVPRFRPQNMFYHSTAIKAYIAIYLGVGLWTHHQTGWWPYPFLLEQTPWRMTMFGISVFAEYFFIFHLQWYIADLIWGDRLSAAYSKIHMRSSSELIKSQSNIS